MTSPELSVYVKGERETALPDQTALEEGSTAQLACEAGAGEPRYGVIFSVDGRAAVTSHYPYRKGHSSFLVSGRKTFLDEACILDDAPLYEVFIIAVSQTHP